jgi:3',5'-cyclic AMP phosphodiesterase CpdA
MPHDGSDAGTTRRKAVQCLLLGSAGVLWTVKGGVPAPFELAGPAAAAETTDFSFAQLSDTHIGFKAPLNPDTNGTLNEGLAKIAAAKPRFMLHTGDVTHLAKPAQFDTADELIKAAKIETFYVPGEHDTIGDGGKEFFSRFGRAKAGGGWYSFDMAGVHFVGLVNVVNLKPGGMGSLGREQLEWLEDDVRGKSVSTPIVVFAHMPLWSVYPQWGWGTDDGATALAYLKRFGSVTVLNGHIHQVIQKVEGNITCHTAYSTAFPQAAPGTPGATPGPLKVPADQLKAMLGVRRVDVVAAKAAVSDTTLAA